MLLNYRAVLLLSIILACWTKCSNAAAKCFENMDQLFNGSTAQNDSQYYLANVNYPKSFPHIVSVKSRYGTKCVGVILTKRFILSSAVCLKSPRQPAISIWLGDVATKNATTEYKTSNSIPIEDIILHPDYEENSFFRNVGLIRLTRDIQFNSRRFPACLELKYGNSVEMASLSNYDQVQEQISITDHGTCNDYFDMRDILESEQFCAKVQNNCAFPTGSPLQRKHEVLDKIYTVIGIVSIRKDCKMTESQLVFSNVTYFIDWIEQVLAPH